MHLAVIVKSSDEMRTLIKTVSKTVLRPPRRVQAFPGYVRWYANGKENTWGTIEYQSGEGCTISKEGTICENLGKRKVPCVWLSLEDFIEMTGVE